MDLWLWTLILFVLATVAIWVQRIIRLEWLPRCPKCRNRGYRHVCDIAANNLDVLVRLFYFG